MEAVRHEEGLEVNPYQDYAAKPPEPGPNYLDIHSHSPSNHAPMVQQKKLPFGWSLWALLTVAAVITALIVGAGVGGGLGASLANCKSELEAGTAACKTPGSSNSDGDEPYAPDLPNNVGNLTQPAECDERGGPNEHTSTSALKFTFYCAFDAPSSDRIEDLVGILAYTFDDCVDACANMNRQTASNDAGRRCESVVFGWQLGREWEQHKANCWLKSGRVEEASRFDAPRYIYAEAPE